MEHLKHLLWPLHLKPETENFSPKKLNAKVLFSCSPETCWSARSLCSNWCQIQIRRQNLRLGRLHTVRRNCSKHLQTQREEIKIFQKTKWSFSKQLQHFTKLKAQSIWTIHEGTKSVQMSIRVYSFQNPIVPGTYRCETVKRFKTLKTDLVKSSKLNENVNSMNAKTDFGPEILMLKCAKTQ